MYLPYSHDVEVTQPSEPEGIAALRDIFAQLRTYTFEKHRHAVRDAHAKSHGVLQGTLRVKADLPGELTRGLGSQPVLTVDARSTVAA